MSTKIALLQRNLYPFPREKKKIWILSQDIRISLNLEKNLYDSDKIWMNADLPLWSSTKSVFINDKENQYFREKNLYD